MAMSSAAIKLRKNSVRFLYAFLFFSFMAFGDADAATDMEAVRSAIRLRDYATALKLLTAAAAEGDAEASYELANLYRNGSGTAKDDKKAFKFYRAAAEKGYVKAQYSLGKMYEYGWGASANKQLARQWYAAAAEQGHAGARASLERLPLTERGPPSVDVPRTVLETGDSPLHLAAETGNAQAINELIRAGADKNARNHAGVTPLMVAVMRHQLQALDALIAAKADINLKDPSGRTALDIAHAKGAKDSEEKLTAVGARSGLAAAKAVNAGQRLARAGDMRENNPFYRGWSPLMIAAWRGDAALTAALSRQGADITARNPAGKTALSLAAGQGHGDVVRELIAHGAATAADADPADNPILEAAEGGHAAALTDLLKAYQGVPHYPEIVNRALTQAIERQNWTVAMALLSAGGNLRESRTGGSALLSAAAKADAALVAALLDRGLDINAVNGSGRTALMLAAQAGVAGTVRLLIAHGAELDRVDAQHMSALVLAARQGYVDIVRQLIAAGAAVDILTTTGNTALMLASENGFAPMVQLLIPVTADINAKNKVGDTALMLAARRAHSDVVRLLLDKGANPRLKNNRREEAFDVTPADQPEVRKMIADAKASRSWISEIF